MSIYDNMLPKEPKKGYLGYYPVTTKEEWEQLPALYKAMDWEPVANPFNKGKLQAVKEVIFDVVYMEPYKISSKVHVHREDIQKILFCSYKNSQCHLYSVSGVVLEDGTTLGAKWLQDSRTGSFAIIVQGHIVARQGGFGGHIPARIVKDAEDNFVYNQNFRNEKISHYTYSNPFRDEPSKEIAPIKKLIEAVCEYGLECSWSDNDMVDTLVGCGLNYDDFKKAGYGDFVKEYFEEDLAKEQKECISINNLEEIKPLDEKLTAANSQISKGVKENNTELHKETERI